MDNTEFLWNLKKGDYIHTEFTYYDTNNKCMAPGFCDCLVKRVWYGYNPRSDDFWDDEIQDMIECTKLINVNGIQTHDMMIGVHEDTVIRYMTDEEIEIFNSKFKR